MSSSAKVLVLYAPLVTDRSKVVVEALDAGAFNAPDRRVVADLLREGIDLLRCQCQAAKRWETGLDATLAEEFPAVEITVIIPEREPAGWRDRWQRAGGKIIEGRCVTLKNSGVLQRFNVYGHAFAPFDSSDALDEEDVDLDEAETLGLT